MSYYQTASIVNMLENNREELEAEIDTGLEFEPVEDGISEFDLRTAKVQIRLDGETVGEAWIQDGFLQVDLGE